MTAIDTQSPSSPPTSGVRYPQVVVQLSGMNGNAYTILGLVRRALKTARVSREEITEFTRDACSGDYDHLLQACLRWVEVR